MSVQKVFQSFVSDCLTYALLIQSLLLTLRGPNTIPAQIQLYTFVWKHNSVPVLYVSFTYRFQTEPDLESVVAPVIHWGSQLTLFLHLGCRVMCSFCWAVGSRVLSVGMSSHVFLLLGCRVMCSFCWIVESCVPSVGLLSHVFFLLDC